MTVYADTSVFVSLYLPDTHSHEAQRYMARHPRIWLTALHRAEWTQAVAQHVFQQKITVQEAKLVFKHFESDRRASVWAEAHLPESVFETCIDLARRHVAQIGTRTLDTLHVATALELKVERFWSFDRRQAKLAEAVGLTLL